MATMATITLSFNNQTTSAQAGSTILQAAELAGITIPTLCNHPDHAVQANCRMCLVDLGGKLVPACATTATNGMKVRTEGADLTALRRTNLSLILSHHALDCQHCARNGVSEVVDLSEEMCSYCYFCDCAQDGNCELQSLALELNVALEGWEWLDKAAALDDSTPGLVKDPNKCILCRRCVGACSELQGIHSWSIVGKGPETVIEPALGGLWSETDCTQCGQCVLDCPTGALSAKEQFRSLFVETDDPAKTVVACLDPTFIPAFAELGGFEGLALTEQNVAAGLRRIGVDVVWSGSGFVHDELVALERIVEERLQSGAGSGVGDGVESGAGSGVGSGVGDGAGLPVVAVADFAAQTLAERYGIAVDASLSATQGFGRYAKGAWAQAKGIAPENIYTIVLTASLSTKAQIAADAAQVFDVEQTDASRDACSDCATPAVDLALTPLEVRRLLHRRGADLSLLAPVDLDAPTPASTPTPAPSLLTPRRGIEVAEKNGPHGPYTVAQAQGLASTRTLLEEAKAGTSPYALIYLSAIPAQGISLD
jgi:ferredoxin